jgi:hypothetical protein
LTPVVRAEGGGHGVLVEFDVNVAKGTPESDVKQCESVEAAADSAAADLAREAHLMRFWKPPVAPGERKTSISVSGR